MRLLILSTSTKRSVVGLVQDKRVLIEISRTSRSGHSDHLMRDIELSLRKAGWTYRDLEGVVVDIGPGSFTGVRVGVSTAKGLVLGLGIPLYGISILHAMLSVNPELPLVPVLVAGRGLLYALVEGSPIVKSPDELARIVPDAALWVSLRCQELNLPQRALRIGLESGLFLEAFERLKPSGNPDEVEPLNLLPPTVRLKTSS